MTTPSVTPHPQHHSLRQVVDKQNFSPDSTLVLFGEIFQRGYANGLIEEAEACEMKMIYSTVGRREKDGILRPLNSEELQTKANQKMINVALEAGFDYQPGPSGKTVIELLKDIKLSDWENARLDFEEINQIKNLAEKDFRRRVRAYVAELEKILPKTGDVIFAHLMAGGVPRAKIIMPIMNKVFKGTGDRYYASSDFWKTDLGKLCAMSFSEVTAQTFQILIDETASIRNQREAGGFKVGYSAYGYHGTEILFGQTYQWQTYSPYLQGWAKKQLEQIAIDAQKSSPGIQACVFNCPEILTNSSSIFQGVEVPLYPLLSAIEFEGGKTKAFEKLNEKCKALLKPGLEMKSVYQITRDFYSDLDVQKLQNFSDWPTHSSKSQLELLLQKSEAIFDMHLDPKNLVTSVLSEVVFRACGEAMLHQTLQPKSSVLWINHDYVAKSYLSQFVDV
ncbi:MAG: enoyl-acyl carrier protein reductase FabMG [Pseudobdellovibrionaceae bacterium]